MKYSAIKLIFPVGSKKINNLQNKVSKIKGIRHIVLAPNVYKQVNIQWVM